MPAPPPLGPALRSAEPPPFLPLPGLGCLAAALAPPSAVSSARGADMTRLPGLSMVPPRPVLFQGPMSLRRLPRQLRPLSGRHEEGRDRPRALPLYLRMQQKYEELEHQKLNIAKDRHSELLVQAIPAHIVAPRRKRILRQVPGQNKAKAPRRRRSKLPSGGDAAADGGAQDGEAASGAAGAAAAPRKVPSKKKKGGGGKAAVAKGAGAAAKAEAVPSGNTEAGGSLCATGDG
mmetsp:Transcript_22958/g.78191  ORF Transcript_22958/g.78191 Transcript_22958/m.78191 type:complete len:233 (-) Transcript_22958:20-718(-)